ncbi:MAG TPA: tetratricopeptide repeat protein [Kofleriaceae bacterium]
MSTGRWWRCATACASRGRFQPDLAMSLNNLGNRLSESRQREAALEVTREAVELYRVLAARAPDAFQPDLTMSLSNLGRQLRDLGRQETAFAATQEALELIWPLFVESPHAHASTTDDILRRIRAHHEALGCEPSSDVLERETSFAQVVRQQT